MSLVGFSGASQCARCRSRIPWQSRRELRGPRRQSDRKKRAGFRGVIPLGLRFLRRFRLARTVEGDRLANERLEGGLVNFFSFVDVDRAAYVSVETRVQ